MQTRPRDSYDQAHVFQEAITLLSTHDSGGLETTFTSQRRQVRDSRSSHELRVIRDSIFRDPTGCLERKLGNLPVFPSKSNGSYLQVGQKKTKKPRCYLQVRVNIKKWCCCLQLVEGAMQETHMVQEEGNMKRKDVFLVRVDYGECSRHKGKLEGVLSKRWYTGQN